MDILKIKDLEIPIEIKNYKNSKSVKIYFKWKCFANKQTNKII